MSETIILGIETSCDETSCAVLEKGKIILSNVIYSQVLLHRRFGGVVPEIASRRHLELIIPVLNEALQKAGVNFQKLEAVAVTVGPGLVGSLLVGIAAAKAVSFALDIPLLAVNHILGHLYAGFLENSSCEPPLLALIVSGGHTFLIHLKDYGEWEVLGKTRDDAAGEALDKGARALGLGYPGGPELEKIAQKGKPGLKFPVANLEEDSLDFSFSGVKTALLFYLKKTKESGEKINIPDVAYAYQEAIMSALVKKTIAAALKIKTKRVLLAGGVAANSYLRTEMADALSSKGIEFFVPSPLLCTDNAAMIASVGYYKLIRGEYSGLDLNALPRLTV